MQQEILHGRKDLRGSRQGGSAAQQEPSLFNSFAELSLNLKQFNLSWL